MNRSLSALSLSAIAATVLLVTAPAFAAPAFAAPAFGAPAPAAITLNVDTAAHTGKVMVVLFDSEAAYAGGAAPVAHAMIDVAAGQTQATFTDLPEGDYAAKMFHDVDGDGKMNTNPFGMPTEPYAFSNNAHGNMGPATWAQAHFTASGPVTQTISLR